MTNTPDYSKMFQDMFAGKFGDTKAVNDMVKDAAECGAKFNKIALETAEKNAELSTAWMKDSLTKFDAFTKVQAEPADYAKSVTDFASASAEAAAEHMSAFAEIAKKVQAETLELLMAAGKDISEDMTAAAKKATTEVTAAAKKATAAK